MAATVAAEQIERASRVFARRFLFNALLPSTVFASAAAAVLVDATVSLPAAITWLTRLDGFTKALLVAGYVAVVWFIAAATASQWRAIVRLYEGYPLERLWHWADGRPRLRYLVHGRTIPGTNRHAARQRALQYTA